MTKEAEERKTGNVHAAAVRSVRGVCGVGKATYADRFGRRKKGREGEREVEREVEREREREREGGREGEGGKREKKRREEDVRDH